jgi:hypothetical protein
MPKIQKLIKKLDKPGSPMPMVGKGIGMPVAPLRTAEAYSSKPKRLQVPEGCRPLKSNRKPVQTLPLKKKG